MRTSALLKVLATGAIALGGASQAFAHEGSPKSQEACDLQLSSWTGKTLLLDASVLLADPLAFQKFPGAHIIVTGTTYAEIEERESDARFGSSARRFTRQMLKLAKSARSSKDIPLPTGGKLSLEFSLADRPATARQSKGTSDNKLLSAAKKYHEDLGDNFSLISMRDNLLVKAFGLGIPAEDYDLAPRQRIKLTEVEISDEDMATFFSTGSIVKPEALNILPNEFVKFKSPSTAASDQTVGRFRYDRENPGEPQKIHALPDFKRLGLPFGPKNLEQAMALDVLMDRSVSCVILDAKAGTGKSFLTLMVAYALYKRNAYQHIYATKPPEFLGGRDPGLLPGGIDEKYQEIIQSYLDNINVILGKEKKNGTFKGTGTELPPPFELLPFEYVRGRSLPNSFTIVDEAQNTDMHAIHTLLTRLGEKGKIVLTGDPTQVDVDRRKMDPSENGLSLAAEKLRDANHSFAELSTVAHVQLSQSVRAFFTNFVANAFHPPEGPLD